MPNRNNISPWRRAGHRGRNVNVVARANAVRVGVSNVLYAINWSARVAAGMQQQAGVTSASIANLIRSRCRLRLLKVMSVYHCFLPTMVPCLFPSATFLKDEPPAAHRLAPPATATSWHTLRNAVRSISNTSKSSASRCFGLTLLKTLRTSSRNI